MQFFLFLVFLGALSVNGYAIIDNPKNGILATVCREYESTTNVSTNVDLKGYFVFTPTFTNDSFLVTFKKFLSTFPTTMYLYSSSYDTGMQNCTIATSQRPKVCTFSLSSTNVYGLSMQIDPTVDFASLVTISTTKKQVIIGPSVTKQRPCVDYDSQGASVRPKTSFCCKTW